MKTESSPAHASVRNSRFFTHLLAVIALVGIFVSQAHAATYTWNGAVTTGTLWNQNTNWNQTTQPTSTDTAYFGATVGLSTAVDLNASTSINALIFGTSGYTIGSGNSAVLTLNNTNNGNGLALSATNTTGANTISAGLGLGTSINGYEYSQANGGTMNISGAITGGASNTYIIFSGGSTANNGFVLTGPNTFQGTVQLRTGITQINADAALGNSSNGVVFQGATGGINGGILDFNYNAGLNYTSRVLTVGASNVNQWGIGVEGGSNVMSINPANVVLNSTGNTFYKTGAGTLQLLANNQFGIGGLTILSGTLDLNGFNDSTSNLTMALGIDNIKNSSATLGTLTITGAGSAESGVIGTAGANNLAVVYSPVSAADQILTGNDNFTGGLTITSGTLQNHANNAGVFGSGDVAISANAGMDLGGNGASLFTGLLSGAGTVTDNVVFGGVATGATLTLTGAAADSQTFSGTLENSSTGSTTTTLALTVAGGTETLNSTNIYTGNTTVSGGTLILTSTLGASNVTVSGGTLQMNVLNAINQGTLSVSSGTVTENTTNALSKANAATALTITGGTVVLSASNNYTGLTQIGTGTLQLQNAGSMASSSIKNTAANSVLQLRNDSNTVFLSSAALNQNSNNSTINVDDITQGILGNTLTWQSGVSMLGSNPVLKVTNGDAYNLTLPSLAAAINPFIENDMNSGVLTINALTDTNIASEVVNIQSSVSGQKSTTFVSNITSPNMTGGAMLSVYIGNTADQPAYVTIGSGCTYTGTTFLSDGTLTVVAPLGNTQINFAGVQQNILNLDCANALNQNALTGVGNACYVYEDATDAISGATTVTTINHGVIVLSDSNNYTGATSLTGNAGYLQLQNAGSIASSPLTLNGGFIHLVNDNNNTSFLDASTTITSNPSFFVDDATPGVTGNTLQFGIAGGITTTGAAGSDVFTVTNGDKYSLTLGTVNSTLGAPGFTNNMNFGTLTVSGLTFSPSLGAQIASFGGASLTGTTSVGAIIQNTGNTVSILANGQGRVVLGGASTYTGTTSILSGIVEYNATPFGSAGAITETGGASVQLLGGITGGNAALSIAGAGDYQIGATGALENLGGANSFGGAITQTAASTISSDAGSLTLSGGITGAFGLTLAGAGNGSISGVIGTGATTLTKIGAGTWTLSNINTYSGATTVSGGALAVNFPGSASTNPISTAALTLGGGALDLSSFTSGANSQTVASLALAAGASTISLVNNGTATVGLTVTAALTRSTGGTIDFISPSGTTVTLTGNSSSSFLGPWAFFGNGASESYAATSSSVVGAAAQTAEGTPGIVGFTSPTTEYAYSTPGSPDTTLTTGTATADTAVFDNASAQTVTLAATTGLQINGILNTNAALIINGPGNLEVGGSNELVIGGGSNVTIGAPIINNGATASALTDANTGTLTLGGVSTYTGATTVGAGTLAITGALGNTAVTVGPATLQLNGAAAINQNTLTVSNAASVVTENTPNALANTAALSVSAGLVTLSQTNGYNGATTITGGQVVLGNSLAAANSAVTLSADNGLVFGSGIGSFTIGGLSGASNEILADTAGNPVALTVSIPSAATATVFTGALTGPGSLVKSGLGTLTLNGNLNTFTGPLTILSGTVNATSSSDNSFGNGIIYLGGVGNSSNAALLTVASANTVFTTNDLIVAQGNGTNILGSDGGSGSIDVKNNILVLTNLDVQGNGAASYELGSNSGGAGGQGLYGAGTFQADGAVVLYTNANNFTGNFLVNTGVLKFLNADNSGMNASNTVTVNSGALFDLNSTTLSIAGLNGAGAVTNSTLSSTLTLGGTGTYSYSGVITGSAALSITKTNTGTQTLSGANTFNGAATVSGGTLILGNNSALGFGGAVAAGQTVGAATVNAAGALDLGGQTITKAITLSGTLTNSGGTATLTNGVAGTTNVAGTVYTAAGGVPTVAFSSGGGSGAAGTASFDLTSTSFTITSAGSGYTAAPTVTISGGGGVGATATATETTGTLTAITITNPGHGYTSAPTFTLTGNATASGNNTNFGLAIAQTSAGSGYTSAPTVAFSGGVGTATGTAVLASVTLSGTGSIGGAGNIVIASPIGGSNAGMIKFGADTLTLSGVNTYTGGTTINAGTLKLDFSATGAPATNILSTTPLILGGGTLNINSTAAASTSAQTLPSLALNGGASTILMSLNGSATGDALTFTAGTITRTLGGTVDFVSPANTSITLTGNASNALLGTYAFFGSGATETYAATNGSSVVTAATQTAEGSSGIVGFTSSLTNYAYTTPGSPDTTLTSGTATANTAVFDNASAQTITLAANTGLQINGILNTNAVLTINGPGNLVVGGNGSSELVIGGGSNVTIGAPITGTGALTDANTGTLTISGANTYTGATNLNAGTVSLTGSLTGGGPVIVNTNATLNEAGGAVISGASSLTTSGATTLSGTNTYTGVTTVNGGTLTVAGLLGNTAVSVNGGGALNLNNALAISQNTLAVNNGTVTENIANALGGSAALTMSGGTVTLSQANNYTGATTVNGGTLVVTGALGNTPVTVGGGLLQLNVASAISQNTLFINSGTVTENTTNALGGSAALYLNGGTVTLSRANNYTGATTITGGSLVLGNSLAVQDSILNIAPNNAITFGPGIGSFTFGGLSGIGNVALTDQFGQALVSLTIGNNNNTGMNYSGILSSANISLVKVGTGTQIFSGLDTFAGSTIINGGVLAVNGMTAMGDVTTVGGASATGTPTLSGSGTLWGSVTVNGAGGGAAGIINPGATAAAPVTLNVGAITFNSGGIFGVDINATASDELVISGAASIASGAGISFTQLTAPAAGNYVLATAASGLNSNAFTGTVPANYRLLATATALDLTHEAVQTLTGASPATINIITGGTTGVTATLTNTAPVNSSALAVSLADNGSTGGTLGAFTGSGPVAANNTTLPVGATLTAGGTGSGLTWSLSNTDPNATTASTSTGGTVNVYGHAAPSLTAGSLNVGDIHAGYAGTVASTNSLSATNGAGFRVSLAGSAPAVNGDALNSITGITPGSVGTISATLPNGLGVGAINDSFTYTFADNSILNGASSNVGTAAITVSGQVYSGQMVWTGASDAWSTDADWVDSQNSGVHAAPGLDTNFTTVDTATFGSTTGPVTVSLNGAAPSLNSVTFTGAGNYTIAQGSGATGLTFAGTAPSITATGTQIISAPVTLASNLTATVTNSGDSLTISGAIGDNSSGYGLTTGGAGTVTLSANNTYGGPTNVTGGTLIVSGSLSGSSSTTVTNATLEGTGNIANGVTIGNNSNPSGTATIEVGLAGTTGAFSTGALTLNSDAVYQFNLNPTLGTSDVLNVNGTLTLNSGAALAGNVLSDEILSGGQVFDIANFTAIAGTFAGLADGTTLSLGDNSYVINYGTAPGYADEITLTATAVPEPQTWAMLIAGAGMLLVFKRKR